MILLMMNRCKWRLDVTTDLSQWHRIKWELQMLGETNLVFTKTTATTSHHHSWVIGAHGGNQYSDTNTFYSWLYCLTFLNTATKICCLQWSYLGYQNSNSASSSKFHYLAFLALLVALMLCSSNFHHWPLLALLMALLLSLGWHSNGLPIAISS